MEIEKKNVIKEDNSYINSFVHLLASTSEHAYPALLDLINYLDTATKLPVKIPFETLNAVFRIALNFANTDEDMLSIYTKWIKFLLKFSDDPFSLDVVSVLPERAKHASEKTEKITELLTEYWNTDYTSEDANYKQIIESQESSNALELLKFLNDEECSPLLNPKAKDDYIRHPDEQTRQVLSMVFEKYFYEDKSEKALGLLNYFSKNWKTFWNAHLCNTRSNEYMDALIFLLTKEKGIVDDQELLILQLELKMLVNDIEGYLDEGDFVNSSVIKEISEEMKDELDDVENASEEMIDKFTNKLYEKVVFNKARSIYKSIPDNLPQEHITALYIDLKKVLEFCEDQNIEKASTMLKEVNRVLFEELRDVSSGVNLVCKMLQTNSRIKMSQYLLKLSYLLEPNSMEMDTLYEAFVHHITRQKLSARQVKSYAEIFEKVNHPQFAVLRELLLTFHKDENSVTELAVAMLKNINIYHTHSQSFYVTVESVFNSGLNIKTVQSFIVGVLGSDLREDHAKTFIHLLVDFFHEQPYMKLKKNFPVITVNQKLMDIFYKTLDEIVDQSMEDEVSEREFETKQYAIDECRAFLFILSSKRPRGQSTVWQ